VAIQCLYCEYTFTTNLLKTKCFLGQKRAAFEVGETPHLRAEPANPSDGSPNDARHQVSKYYNYITSCSVLFRTDLGSEFCYKISLTCICIQDFFLALKWFLRAKLIQEKWENVRTIYICRLLEVSGKGYFRYFKVCHSLHLNIK
jgi:hypothetical protein